MNSICICKITCKPMGKFAENLNLGNRVLPPWLPTSHSFPMIMSHIFRILLNYLKLSLLAKNRLQNKHTDEKHAINLLDVCFNVLKNEKWILWACFMDPVRTFFKRLIKYDNTTAFFFCSLCFCYFCLFVF